MGWFVLTLLATLCWGFADLFYKLGTDDSDRYSHLRIAVWVGIFFGLMALAVTPLSESGLPFFEMWRTYWLYAPISLCYILSMVIGYAGLRYLEVSIISPIQNASGAFSTLAMILWIGFTAGREALAEEVSVLDGIATVLVFIGLVGLARVEQKIAQKENPISKEDVSKYRYGALALLFPITYCLLDTAGTAMDGIVLSEDYGMGIGEMDALILYGSAFFVIGVVSWIIITIKDHKPYNPFAKHELKKGAAAAFETGGQVFYVYAMAANPMVAAPIISAYCVVSVILGRLIVKEKLSRAQYICILTVIAGIVLFGISEGIGYA